MSTIQLKQIQKYKNVIILCAVLLLIAVVLEIVTTTAQNQKQKIAKLDPPTYSPTAAFSTKATKIISWKNVSLGSSQQKISTLLGNPVNREDKEGKAKIFYESSVKKEFHIVTYQQDKAIRIDRYVNERQEKIIPNSYNQLFGTPQILRQGEGLVTQIQSYTVNSNEYIILEVDTQYNQVYKIISLIKSEFDLYKKNEIKQGENLEDSEVEPDF